MPTQSNDYLDALIVGAGFSGLHTLAKLRRLGFSVKIYEAGSSLGGTWYWNRYPGARVDSETPTYQLLEEKEAWIDFDWTERFPGWSELRRYFHHADKKLGLSADILYNTTVTEADWDETRRLWKVTTAAGSCTWARQLILCTGFAAKKYTPQIPGIESFRGEIYHSADWPHPRDDGTSAVELKGKRVAVIGTGASGVQIIQEIGGMSDVPALTVYQRTPNLALPMRQAIQREGVANPNKEWKFPPKSEYEAMIKSYYSTFGGIVLDFLPTKWEDATPAERRAVYEGAWDYGGFGFWLSSYIDIFFVQEANDEVYAFWAEKVRPRIKDPIKRDLLAPLTPPHCFGTKRPSLEQNYFEVYNQDHVKIVDLSASPISQITERGIKTEKEMDAREFDVIIFATGFDSVTGGILNIKITVGGTNMKMNTIQDKWGNGVRSYLGMTAAGFPNMFWLYGPQAPTAFANGPTCAGIQGSWIVDLMVAMRAGGKERVEAEEGAEACWVKLVNDMWDSSLFAGTASWYQGSNIPGKKREPLNYIGGIPAYIAALEGCKEKGYEGFKLV